MTVQEFHAWIHTHTEEEFWEWYNPDVKKSAELEKAVEDYCDYLVRKNV
jgi:hypothetical protein